MSESANETALAPLPELPGQIAPIEWLKPLKAIGGYTSLDLQTQRGRQLFVMSQQSECESLDRFINGEIVVKDIVLHPARREDEQSGEIHFWTRCVLILADDSMISCASIGVMKSLMLAVILHGAPPWPTGIRGRVTQSKVGEQKRWYQIEWELLPCQPSVNGSPSTASPNTASKKK